MNPYQAACLSNTWSESRNQVEVDWSIHQYSSSNDEIVYCWTRHLYYSICNIMYKLWYANTLLVYAFPSFPHTIIYTYCHSRTTIPENITSSLPCIVTSEARVTMQRQWTSDISNISLFYYGNKVFIVCLHKPILYWSFSNSRLSGSLAEGACACRL